MSERGWDGAKKRPKDDPWDWYTAEVDNPNKKRGEENLKPELKQKKVRRTKADMDLVVLDLIKTAEQKVHQRVRQQHQLILIQKHVDHYLQPHINVKIEAYKSQILAQSQSLRQNYQYGLANKDLLCLSDKYQQALTQMKAVHQFTDKQPTSEALSAALTAQQKQRIRGYLSVKAKELLADETIIDIRLSELTPLISKSNVVLIESDDRQRIEFKIVFQEVKQQLCGPDKILDEQVLISFDIYPKKLKLLMAQVDKDVAEKKLQQARKADKKAGGGAGGWIVEDNKDDNTGKLVFPENDALTFSPPKFAALITRMERQRSAYVLREGTDKRGAT